MNKVVKLNEKELHSLISESVKRIINESDDRSEELMQQFADILTDCHPNTAAFIARELYMGGASDTMESIIDHMNGYGYGGTSFSGDEM